MNFKMRQHAKSPFRQKIPKFSVASNPNAFQQRTFPWRWSHPHLRTFNFRHFYLGFSAISRVSIILQEWLRNVKLALLFCVTLTATSWFTDSQFFLCCSFLPAQSCQVCRVLLQRHHSVVGRLAQQLFNGPGRAKGRVCVCVSTFALRIINFELNGLWLRHSARWFTLTVSICQFPSTPR